VPDEKKITKSRIQNLMLENRERLNVSGVIDVDSFNDETVVVDTELGMLVIRGEDLHISKLNLDSSELCVEGEISSCEYSDRDNGRSRGGFIARLFK
jgi:sporulation protein YabP